MDEARRITPEQVKAAYEKTGLKPARGGWYPQEGCACGLGAMLAEIDGEVWRPRLVSTVASRLGVELDYLNGFVRGFDGRDGKLFGHLEPLGHTDGQAAAALVFAAPAGESRP